MKVRVQPGILPLNTAPKCGIKLPALPQLIDHPAGLGSTVDVDVPELHENPDAPASVRFPGTCANPSIRRCHPQVRIGRRMPTRMPAEPQPQNGRKAPDPGDVRPTEPYKYASDDGTNDRPPPALGCKLHNPLGLYSPRQFRFETGKTGLQPMLTKCPNHLIHAIFQIQLTFLDLPFLFFFVRR